MKSAVDSKQESIDPDPLEGHSSFVAGGQRSIIVCGWSAILKRSADDSIKSAWLLRTFPCYAQQASKTESDIGRIHFVELPLIALKGRV